MGQSGTSSPSWYIYTEKKFGTTTKCSSLKGLRTINPNALFCVIPPLSARLTQTGCDRPDRNLISQARSHSGATLSFSRREIRISAAAADKSPRQHFLPGARGPCRRRTHVFVSHIWESQNSLGFDTNRKIFWCDEGFIHFGWPN